MRINNDTVPPKITFLYTPLFLPPSCTSPHISPDTSEGTQDKEGVGFGVAGGEGVTEGAVVVVEMILRGKYVLGFRMAVDEGVTEGTVVVEETSDGCSGGILGDDTVSIVVAV